MKTWAITLPEVDSIHMFYANCYYPFLSIIFEIVVKGNLELDTIVIGQKSCIKYTTYCLFREIPQRRKKVLHPIKGFIHRMWGGLSSDMGAIVTGSLCEYMRVHRLDPHKDLIPLLNANLGLWLPLGLNYFRFPYQDTRDRDRWQSVILPTKWTKSVYLSVAKAKRTNRRSDVHPLSGLASWTNSSEHWCHNRHHLDAGAFDAWVQRQPCYIWVETRSKQR
jgi:hypothetical protein